MKRGYFWLLLVLFFIVAAVTAFLLLRYKNLNSYIVVENRHSRISSIDVGSEDLWRQLIDNSNLYRSTRLKYGFNQVENEEAEVNRVRIILTDKLQNGFTHYDENDKIFASASLEFLPNNILQITFHIEENWLETEKVNNLLHDLIWTLASDQDLDYAKDTKLFDLKVRSSQTKLLSGGNKLIEEIRLK